MTTYKFVNQNSGSQICPNDYDYKQILEKYKIGGYCNFGMDSLLKFGFICYAGWRYNFRDELHRYLYLTATGDTGTAWAPNVKLLERNLHHKIKRAFRLDK